MQTSFKVVLNPMDDSQSRRIQDSSSITSCAISFFFTHDMVDGRGIRSQSKIKSALSNSLIGKSHHCIAVFQAEMPAGSARAPILTTLRELACERERNLTQTHIWRNFGQRRSENEKNDNECLAAGRFTSGVGKVSYSQPTAHTLILVLTISHFTGILLLLKY